MKYRIKVISSGYYQLQTKHWWFPFWITRRIGDGKDVTSRNSGTYQQARDAINRIKRK